MGKVVIGFKNLVTSLLTRELVIGFLNPDHDDNLTIKYAEAKQKREQLEYKRLPKQHFTQEPNLRHEKTISDSSCSSEERSDEPRDSSRASGHIADLNSTEKISSIAGTMPDKGTDLALWALPSAKLVEEGKSTLLRENEISGGSTLKGVIPDADPMMGLEAGVDIVSLRISGGRDEGGPRCQNSEPINTTNCDELGCHDTFIENFEIMDQASLDDDFNQVSDEFTGLAKAVSDLKPISVKGRKKNKGKKMRLSKRGEKNAATIGVVSTDVKRTNSKVRMRRQIRRELKEILDGNSGFKLNNSELSVSDNGILMRNSLFRKEAEETLKVSGALGLKFAISDEKMLEIFEQMEEEDRAERVGQKGKEKSWEYEFSGSTGSAGGLITIWSGDFFELHSKVISSRYILLIGLIKPLQLLCGIGNIYAPNDDGERSQLWEELLSILSNLAVHWCLGGDFNVVRYPHEKNGVGYNLGAMFQFSDFIEELGLVDLQLEGGKFTWSSNREEPCFCRLDRFLISVVFIENLNALTQKILPRSLSDHNPVVLCEVTVDWGPKPFRFFNHWLEFDGFNAMVQSTWKQASTISKGRFRIWKSLKYIKSAIKEWQLKEGIADFCKISTMEEEINSLDLELQSGQFELEKRNLILKKKKELWNLYRCEERSWSQKSRMKWVQEGDRNTKFFHIVATARRRTNFISSLKFQDRVIDNPENLKEAIALHFELHFNNSNELTLLYGNALLAELIHQNPFAKQCWLITVLRVRVGTLCGVV
ncbi:hypothetical protein REPUB_Repub02eG0163900 [Reevesia pubescens]